jgi:hypothetical protein
MHICVPFSWTQRTLKVKSGGHLELQQGTGLSSVDIRLCGTKSPFKGLGESGLYGLKPKC